MLVKQDGQFNMWDTNGRRSDVLNALTIYLNILNDLDKEYPDEKWARYPSSIKHNEFYKSAIEASPDVFGQHSSFDYISALIEKDRLAFNRKDEDFVKKIGLLPYKSSNALYKDFDTNVESRARHYTSNLVKIGFADNDRNITQVGRDYMSQKTKKDKLETVLPLDDINLILLRQLLKMRIFKKETDGHFSYYNPALYCMKLLLSDDTYANKELSAAVLTHSEATSVSSVPDCFMSDEIVLDEDFKKHIKSGKSNSSIQSDYYQFYLLLYDFVKNQCQTTYDRLVDFYKSSDQDGIKGAFLMDTPLLLNVKQKWLSFSDFQSKNKNSAWLVLGNNFNEFFYKQHISSKSNRLLKEYGDTLFRLLTNTGIFNFSKALPELLYKDVFKEIFAYTNIDELISGVVTEMEYEQYEIEYGYTNSVSEILKLSKASIEKIISNLQSKYGADIKNSLSSEKARNLIKHIEAKYPKKKIIELLDYFSDRKNDSKIQEYVNKSADVPTIYEYIVAVAWFYISDKDFSVFNSINLTLDGNYEPAHHAAGGAGDIVIEYPDRVIMLEATLMNKSAQKRGEWEPVLRHSINLKSDNEDKQVTTLFVADELDTNTINIWRAVASVPLESTHNGSQTDHVYIMPLTNSDISGFIQNGVKSTNIINAVRKSYDGINYSFNKNWRNDILQSISA